MNRWGKDRLGRGHHTIHKMYVVVPSSSLNIDNFSVPFNLLLKAFNLTRPPGCRSDIQDGKLSAKGAMNTSLELEGLFYV